ncbi:MAG TPA: flagellar export protein FliJ [Tepidiformaceae bacterium]|nr:flagellar export protein FliJ [Tepidiformaceae bacterium]
MTLTPQRLKRLVKHRERLERLQERELAEALRLHRRREEALTESLGNREALLDIQRPATGPLDAADLQAELAYLRRVDREILARRAALQHSANDVEAERAELLDRRRDRKAIEALLDHRLEEERLARNRAERALIDELAVTRWRRPGTGA